MVSEEVGSVNQIVTKSYCQHVEWFYKVFEPGERRSQLFRKGFHELTQVVWTPIMNGIFRKR